MSETGSVYRDRCLKRNVLDKGVDARIQYQEDAVPMLEESQDKTFLVEGKDGVMTLHRCVEAGCKFAGLILRDELGADSYRAFYTDSVDFSVDPCAEEPQT